MHPKQRVVDERERDDRTHTHTHSSAHLYGSRQRLPLTSANLTVTVTRGIIGRVPTTARIQPALEGPACKRLRKYRVSSQCRGQDTHHSAHRATVGYSGPQPIYRKRVGTRTIIYKEQRRSTLKAQPIPLADGVVPVGLPPRPLRLHQVHGRSLPDPLMRSLSLEEGADLVDEIIEPRGGRGSRSWRSVRQVSHPV